MKIIKTGDQQHEVMVNIYRKFIPQIGLPCEKPQVIMDTTDRWNILENGTLYLDDHDVLLDTVSYCLSPQWDSTINENIFLPLSCPMTTELDTATTLNTYGMLLSVVFIIPTIFVYLMLKELRENIKNKIFICYLICMAVSYLIISLLNISRAVFHIFSCSLIGFIGYYFIMATFVWISALCFEIWYNFNAASTDFCPKRSAIRFKIYSLYAWGLTGIMTAVLIWCQLSEYVDEMYKPGIGVKVCWLDTRKWSAAIYFYGPSTIIMIFSTITFIYVSRKIYEIRFDALAKLHKQHFLQENLLILIRLFFIMGISWIMDIISFAMRDHQNFHFIFDLTDFCNATQGVLIFILFVVRPEVMGPLKKK
ncbi:G-protein coupled receptor Mth2-like [Musca vetustissima]|uniref:G-protein coupled receptor Mth2-like n=1 Tax=Musca vetustissima TaxID=27455 RepID=UPI002AB7CB5A|nr:G-protein coupled receptor Mth2-like [Musca vetustissima]